MLAASIPTPKGPLKCWRMLRSGWGLKLSPMSHSFPLPAKQCRAGSHLWGLRSVPIQPCVIQLGASTERFVLGPKVSPDHFHLGSVAGLAQLIRMRSRLQLS